MFPHLKVEVSEFHSNNGRCVAVVCSGGAQIHQHRCVPLLQEQHCIVQRAAVQQQLFLQISVSAPDGHSSCTKFESRVSPLLLQDPESAESRGHHPHTLSGAQLPGLVTLNPTSCSSSSSNGGRTASQRQAVHGQTS